MRLVTGRPLVAGEADRSSEEQDARDASSRFARGSVAIQDKLFATESDLERERIAVAEFRFRN